MGWANIEEKGAVAGMFEKKIKSVGEVCYYPVQGNHEGKTTFADHEKHICVRTCTSETSMCLRTSDKRTASCIDARRICSERNNLLAHRRMGREKKEESCLLMYYKRETKNFTCERERVRARPQEEKASRSHPEQSVSLVFMLAARAHFFLAIDAENVEDWLLEGMAARPLDLVVSLRALAIKFLGAQHFHPRKNLHLFSSVVRTPENGRESRWFNRCSQMRDS